MWIMNGWWFVLYRSIRSARHASTHKYAKHKSISTWVEMFETLWQSARIAPDWKILVISCRFPFTPPIRAADYFGGRIILSSTLPEEYGCTNHSHLKHWKLDATMTLQYCPHESLPCVPGRMRTRRPMRRTVIVPSRIPVLIIPCVASRIPVAMLEGWVRVIMIQL